MNKQRLCCVLSPDTRCADCREQVCRECYWIMGKTTITSKQYSDGSESWEQKYVCDECHDS